MKSHADFIERLRSDKEFAEEVNAACLARRKTEGQTTKDVLIPVAKEFGYEMSEEELNASLSDSLEELSEEEMAKVAGGFLDPITIGSGIFVIITTVIMSVDKTLSD